MNEDLFIQGGRGHWTVKLYLYPKFYKQDSSFAGLNTLGAFIKFWFLGSDLQCPNFAIILIYRRCNFVYHHWRGSSIYLHCLIPQYSSIDQIDQTNLRFSWCLRSPNYCYVRRVTLSGIHYYKCTFRTFIEIFVKKLVWSQLIIIELIWYIYEINQHGFLLATLLYRFICLSVFKFLVNDLANYCIDMVLPCSENKIKSCDIFRMSN